ncbi:MAG: hypothetical protein WBI14_08540 [Anaerolineaceae bacterium]
MKIKLLLVGLVFVLVTMACSLTGGAEPLPTPTPTPDLGWQWYEGAQMKLMLPPSWVQRDVAQDLPAILETIKTFFSGDSNFLTELIDDFEGNVAWWGYDGGSPAVYPTRLLIIHNAKFEATPLSLLSTAIRLLGGSDADSIVSSNGIFAGMDMVKFSQATDQTGWVAYAFKAESQLWVAVFMTTPANLAAQAKDFEKSIESIVINHAN